MPLKVHDKEKILDVCFDVFVTHGYTSTSTAMLAKAAGISKALIFHHFKSKKNLYIEILGRCFDKMAAEVSEEPIKEYKDYFEAKENNGLFRVDYMKKHPKISKILFEAFYTTPEELIDDIAEFRVYIEEKFKNHKDDTHQLIKRLFKEIPFRKGVDPREAYELINIVSEHFRKKLASELTDEKNILDDTYWNEFLDKKNRFLDMVRHGIEE